MFQTIIQTRVDHTLESSFVSVQGYGTRSSIQLKLNIFVQMTPAGKLLGLGLNL